MAIKLKCTGPQERPTDWQNETVELMADKKAFNKKTSFVKFIADFF